MAEKRPIDANVVLAKKFTAGLSDASGNYYGYADVVFADDIENAPTTDAVEVERGWWIDTPDEMTKYKCDNPKCGFPSFVPWNYCPNCGAKMDGVTGG